MLAYEWPPSNTQTTTVFDLLVIASAMFKKKFSQWKEVLKHSFVHGKAPKQLETFDVGRIIEIIMQDMELCSETFLHKEACGVPLLAIYLARMIEFVNSKMGHNNIITWRPNML